MTIWLLNEGLEFSLLSENAWEISTFAYPLNKTLFEYAVVLNGPSCDRIPPRTM
jgi:hypothetical protein